MDEQGRIVMFRSNLTLAPRDVDLRFCYVFPHPAESGSQAPNSLLQNDFCDPKPISSLSVTGRPRAACPLMTNTWRLDCHRIRRARESARFRLRSSSAVQVSSYHNRAACQRQELGHFVAPRPYASGKKKKKRQSVGWVLAPTRAEDIWPSPGIVDARKGVYHTTIS